MSDATLLALLDEVRDKTVFLLGWLSGTMLDVRERPQLMDLGLIYQE